MADIPTWTLPLNRDEHDLVLRGLLAVIPGMVGGDGREFFADTVKRLQDGAGEIVGHWMELLSVADSVEHYFNQEAATCRNRETSADASLASRLAARAATLKNQKSTGIRAAKPKPEPKPVPKPAKQANLFGDEG
jgi:hypothetical protein